MKKKIFYILVTAVTFALGVVVSPIHFRGYSIACGPHGSSSSFTSSYLLNVVSSESYYESFEEADAAWQGQLKAADLVIEQAALFNPDSEKVESRAVIRSRWNDGEQYFAVVWTEKKVLHKITCSSLKHVLAFEKKQLRNRRNTTSAWSGRAGRGLLW
jgi:hypothetical protein